MAQRLIMQWTEDGDLIFLSKLKGSNPNREKHPTINCPHCGKFMFYVFDKNAKNDTLCFDVEDPRYCSFYRDHIRVCPKCHHRIGIIKLTPKLRRAVGFPQRHECRQKIVI